MAKSQVWCAAVEGEWSAQNICERTGLVTATEWCLSKLPQPTNHSHYPMLCFIVEVCSSCPVGNAWPERAAGALEWQKGRLSSWLQNHLQNPLRTWPFSFIDFHKCNLSQIIVLVGDFISTEFQMERINKRQCMSCRIKTLKFNLVQF